MFPLAGQSFPQTPSQLADALRGAFAEVLDDGAIAVGAAVAWEEG